MKKSIKGTIMIRKPLETQAPCIVYVSHKNSFGHWVCEILNTQQTCFSDADDLIPFNYREFMQLFCAHKIQSSEQAKERYAKQMKEWTGDTNKS